jgi:hypothetical protein
MLRYKRIVSAVALAAMLIVPALFEEMWMVSNVMSIGIIVANLPGILLAGRHFPPEGYPGQSPIHCILIVLVQGAVWYFLFLALHVLRLRLRRRPPSPETDKNRPISGKGQRRRSLNLDKCSLLKGTPISSHLSLNGGYKEVCIGNGSSLLLLQH